MTIAEGAPAQLRWCATLAPVERELLTLLAGGCREVQIAEALALSLQSVEQHIVRLARGLGLRDRRALAAYARYAGLGRS